MDIGDALELVGDLVDVPRTKRGCLYWTLGLIVPGAIFYYIVIR